MTNTAEVESVFDSLVFEDIPDAPPRPPGKGREPVKWEEHLAPLEAQLLNKPARLWAYEAKSGATSRMSAVRSRLNDAAPSKNWELKVRPIPNTDPQLYGVYAVFHGEYTPEQQLSNAQDRQKRRDAIAAAKERAQATSPDGASPETPTAPVEEAKAPQTAKEKLAATAAAKK